MTWYHLGHTARAVAAATAWLVKRLREPGPGTGTLVLAGGRTPVALYERLAQAPIPWERLVLVPSDERCLPEGAPERNDVMLARALLSRLPVKPGGFVPIPAHKGPAVAAAEFEKVAMGVPPIRAAILGLGEDGHTASLFPGDEALEARGWAAPVWRAPKPPPERVTLTLEALGRADDVLFLALGTAKEEALRRWMAGEALPAARVHPRKSLAVFTDRDPAFSSQR
ncbi:MAG: 6-phosphogluconolactonase [Limnochordaceae bacterium]|nr:6-phosphogluconolactonase [Limnochordaceae bacterium]